MQGDPVATRLEISFNTKGEVVDKSIGILPNEDLKGFLERCQREVEQYFKFEWKNWYRLQGKIHSGWLSESEMYGFLRKRLGT